MKMLIMIVLNRMWCKRLRFFPCTRDIFFSQAEGVQTADELLRRLKSVKEASSQLQLSSGAPSAEAK